MPFFKLTLAYDGAEFSGWQAQPGQRTVQGELERAWHEITGETVRVNAAGRTDAGVHAAGQVVGVESATQIPPATLVAALNAKLPEDAAVLRRRSSRPKASTPRTTPSASAIATRSTTTVAGRCSCAATPGTFRRRSTWPRCSAAAKRSSARTTSPAFNPPAPNANQPSARSSPSRWHASGAGQGGESPVVRRTRRARHHRRRRRRLPLQHGPHDRRHAGRGRPRQATSRIDRRGARRRRPLRRRPNRAAPRPLAALGRVLSCDGVAASTSPVVQTVKLRALRRSRCGNCVAARCFRICSTQPRATRYVRRSRIRRSLPDVSSDPRRRDVRDLGRPARWPRRPPSP